MYKLVKCQTNYEHTHLYLHKQCCAKAYAFKNGKIKQHFYKRNSVSVYVHKHTHTLFLYKCPLMVLYY